MPRHHKLESPIAALQQRIDYQFKKPSLLERALTHSSASECHMERLEFLGDAVLGLIISQALHSRFSDSPEGDLSRMRAALVRKEKLLVIARQWQLEQAVIVGDSQKGESGIKSSSIIANAVEAIIGAVFEDGGWQEAHRLVRGAWQDALDSINVEDARDAKSRLQEFTQGEGWGLPEYQVSDLGVAAQARFEALCFVQGQLAGRGKGSRKKSAELAAAKAALGKLTE